MNNEKTMSTKEIEELERMSDELMVSLGLLNKDRRKNLPKTKERPISFVHGCYKFHIYYEGEEFPKEKYYLAFGPDSGDFSKYVDKIPKSYTGWAFLSGFDQTIEIKPFVRMLFIADIKKPLLPNTIPLTVDQIHFIDGFSHQLGKGVIPTSVKYLTFGAIKTQLTQDSLHDDIYSLTLDDGFDQTLTPGTLPQIQNIDIGDIKKPLINGSLPKGLKSITFLDGYNHTIQPGVVPSTIQGFYTRGIKQQLIPGSVPNGPIEFTVQNYEFPLTKGVIPPSVGTMIIYDDKTRIIKDSIPPTVYICRLARELRKENPAYMENFLKFNRPSIVRN